jgi:Fic family protein
MPAAAYRWHPVEDYRVPPETLAKTELGQLAEVWAEQRDDLDQAEGLKIFNERLRREWAIETGLLERVYTLDRGVTRLLVERGIEASLIPHGQGGQDPQRVVAILRDHEAAIEGLFDFIRDRRPLSTSYIQELHALLTRNQPTTTAVDSLGKALVVPLLHGEYKSQPNNPTRRNGTLHEYCPPEQVASELDRLIELHHQHEGVPPEVEAAWLHHRFTQIHPFQDGNGRVARALSTLVLVKAGWFPLVIRDVQAERTRYLDALEAADGGDLRPLVKVVAAAQKKAFVQALGISGQILRQARVDQEIQAAREKLQTRRQAQRQPWESVKTTAASLLSSAERRLREVAAKLEEETAPLLTGARFWAESEPEGGDRAYFFRRQIVETARSLGYYANTRAYRAWARLALDTGPRAEILISFHGAGHEFRGLLAASACFFRREETDEGDREITDVTPLTGDFFQLNYRETPHDAQSRFEPWLEDALVEGLELWRRGL